MTSSKTVEEVTKNALTEAARADFAALVTKEVLTVEDLAEVAGVATHTVRWWVSVNRAPRSYKLPGGRRILFARSDVLDWMQASYEQTVTAGRSA